MNPRSLTWEWESGADPGGGVGLVPPHESLEGVGRQGVQVATRIWPKCCQGDRSRRCVDETL